MERMKANFGMPPAIDFWPKKKKNTQELDPKKIKDLFATHQVPLTLPWKEKMPMYDKHIKIFPEWKHGRLLRAYAQC